MQVSILVNLWQKNALAGKIMCATTHLRRCKFRPHCGHAAFHETVSLLSWLINNHHTLAKSRFYSHGCGCWWSCSGCQGICRHSLGQIQVLCLQLNYPIGAGRWRVSDLCYHWFMVNDMNIFRFYYTRVCVLCVVCVCVSQAYQP